MAMHDPIGTSKDPHMKNAAKPFIISATIPNGQHPIIAINNNPNPFNSDKLVDFSLSEFFLFFFLAILSPYNLSIS